MYARTRERASHANTRTGSGAIVQQFMCVCARASHTLRTHEPAYLCAEMTMCTRSHARPAVRNNNETFRRGGHARAGSAHVNPGTHLHAHACWLASMHTKGACNLLFINICIHADTERHTERERSTGRWRWRQEPIVYRTHRSQNA